MVLYLVAVATTLPGLDDVAGVRQVYDDGIGPTLGDAELGGDIPQTRLRISGEAEKGPAVISEKAPIRHGDTLSGGKFCPIREINITYFKTRDI